MLKFDRKKQIVKGDKKVIRAWIMYDWSNSVFQLTILSIVFPIYFTKITTTGDSSIVSFFGIDIINSVLYSWSIAVAYLIVAFFSPFFSAIADYTGRRRAFMKFFTFMGATACGLLFFFDKTNINWGVIYFIIATIGYGGSIVFYNSFLPVIAESKDQDRISANGYAMGYLGAVLLLLFNLAMIKKPELFGITDKLLPAKISFVTVFVWWVSFSQITFFRLPKYTFGNRTKGGNVLLKGYGELRKVFAQIRKMPLLSIYLVGYFFMTMGLLTVMFMAAIYGRKELKLGDEILVPTILLIQLLGMVGAWVFVKLSKWFGNIRSLIFAIISWILICFGAFFITDATGFIIVAIFVGLIMGGTQALARSTYSKMLPETRDHTSFFSFFDVMEKTATVAGTFSFGIIEAITGSMRYSVLAIVSFFLISLVFMLLLNRKQGILKQIPQ